MQKKKDLAGNPDEKRQLERPNLKWRGDIKMDLRGTYYEVMGWNYVDGIQ
jgi:hypothetical protein